jgi:hypothetical protein
VTPHGAGLTGGLGMAVIDDLNRLAGQDVVYLTRSLSGSSTGSAEVFRGRLREALSGDWVFITSTGQNGVAGIFLGPQLPSWTSSESPESGLQINITTPLVQAEIPQFTPLNEVIVLTSVVPADLAD